MPHYRIGLMVGNKSIDYVHAIRMGVQNTIEEAGHTLVALSDLIPFHSRINTEAYFRVAFGLAARLGLDAVIVPAGIIASYLTSEHDALDELLGMLDPARTLVIERQIEGYRCVSKDNASGMRACMRHLIEAHGFRRIAFVGGPPSSTGAAEREDIYYEEMAAHGLEVTRSLVAHGDLSGECGDAIDRLIDDNPGLEAIACCCDLIAHTVYRVLDRRGLRAGVDLAVTGFDDLDISAHIDPPLSTVHMTGYDLGCVAGREALRLCEGLPPAEPVLVSTFVRRGSCGEDPRGRVESLRALLAERPFPSDAIVDELVSSSLSMADSRLTAVYRAAVRSFLDKVGQAYRRHRQNPEAGVQLFRREDLAQLFRREFDGHLSLDGFQAMWLALLQAFVETSPEDDVAWAIEQTSTLHMYVARTLYGKLQENQQRAGMLGWSFFHLTDDALCASARPRQAYELILRDLAAVGVRWADLYLLAEPVTFLGARSLSFADGLRPVGSFRDGRVSVSPEGETAMVQDVLDRLPVRADEPGVYTVGGIVAGDELVGVAAMDMGELDEDGQLIAFLNLGAALKHLQLVASERESNEILSRSNLLLQRRSYFDGLTGALNRRGFEAELERVFGEYAGDMAGLFYLDLVGLRSINEAYGHDMGDRAIRQMADLLRQSLPDGAILGRYGSSKFVACMRAKDGRTVADIGHTVEDGVAALNAADPDSYQLSVTYGGVVMPIGEEAFASVDDAMALADRRFYEMRRDHGRSYRYGGLR